MAGSTEKKRQGELKYWMTRKEEEGALLNSWYERFYTDHFGLSKDFYTGKRILDIGCGPRGSLEWATRAAEKVGADPLAHDYLELGAAEQSMTYVACNAESIPYPSGHFDIVCSFNSIDHVDNLRRTIREIKRLVKKGGLFLLLTDVHDEPTPQEPVTFDWSLLKKFPPQLLPQVVRMYEKSSDGMYASIEEGILFDHSDSTTRYGILSARFVRT